ncbi:MAG: GNAT family N-acetyltransferase [Rhizobiaceae bacterium]
MISITQENDFDFMGSAYADLFEQADATAFQCPAWLDAFYRDLARESGAEPVIITLRSKGDLLGVVPLIRRRLRGVSIVEATDLGVSDYACPVLHRSALQSLSDERGLVKSLRNAIGRVDILRVRPVLPEHLAAWNLLLGCKEEPLDFSAHAVALQPPYQEWRKANIDRSLSGMIARKGKRWKKQHAVSLERLQDPQSASLAIQTLARLRQGRFEGDPIQTEPVMDFYASVAATGCQTGEAETWMLSSDGEIAAVLFGLTHKGRFLYLLIGADYDGFARHSPGLVLYDWIIEDWMERGGTSFDFTIGDEPFKAKFGTSASKMSMYLEANSLLGKLVLNLFGAKLRRENG